MNIPFPSLEVPCLVLSFQFHNLCHKECVSRFDLARLSLRLGPTLPLPSPPSTLPCPWTLSLAQVIHAYCTLPVPEYERHYYTRFAYFTYISAQYV